MSAIADAVNRWLAAAYGPQPWWPPYALDPREWRDLLGFEGDDS